MRRLLVFLLLLTISNQGLHARAQRVPQSPDGSLIRLQKHNPIYIALGTPDTKAQLSFKIQFFLGFELYAAYTQLLMWDLFKRSAPIRDINYNPEVFYRLHVNREKIRFFEFGGYDHESNGRDDAASRGWNRVYVRYHAMQPLGERLEALWSIKARVPFAYDPMNKDLSQYRGLYEFVFTLKNLMVDAIPESELALRLWPGGRFYLNPFLGGQELTFRVRTPPRALAPVIVAQVFQGFGENLLEYRERRFGARAGFGF
jgi:phospholipase A1